MFLMNQKDSIVTYDWICCAYCVEVMCLTNPSCWFIEDNGARVMYGGTVV